MSANTVTMEELADLLEETERGNYDIDRPVGFLLDGWVVHVAATDRMYGLIRDHEGNFHADSRGGLYPAYSENIETALGLAERLRDRLGQDINTLLTDAVADLGQRGYRDDKPYAPQLALSLVRVMVKNLSS